MGLRIGKIVRIVNDRRRQKRRQNKRRGQQIFLLIQANPQRSLNSRQWILRLDRESNLLFCWLKKTGVKRAGPGQNGRDRGNSDGKGRRKMKSPNIAAFPRLAIMSREEAKTLYRRASYIIEIYNFFVICCSGGLGETCLLNASSWRTISGSSPTC